MIKTVDVEGGQARFLLTPWISRVFNKDNPLAPLEAYKKDPINTMLTLAWLSYREAENPTVTEKQFFDLYSQIPDDQKKELKEELIENFLDMGADKDPVLQFRAIWDNCTDEQRTAIEEVMRGKHPAPAPTNGKLELPLAK